MALPSSTFTTYDAIGQKEDVSPIIDMISPTDTPFQMLAKRGKAIAVRHEFQTDALASPDTGNAVLEGDAATTDAATPTVRLSNICQISDKVPRVAGTLEAVQKYGRGSELAYQMSKRSKEWKRDVEAILTSNQASVAGDATTARKLGSLRAWLTTNTSVGAGGSNGGFSGGAITAATNGTTRAFGEDLLRTVNQACYDAGGEPRVLMVGTFNRRVVSSFTGYSTATREADSRKIVATVDVYVTDFGALKVTTNRFQPGRNAYMLDMDHWEIPWLRPPFYKDLAVDGDSERKQLIGEYTLASLNEAASGVIADLTTA